MWTVYIHTNKINSKVYIGITGQSVDRRWRSDGSGYKKCLMFYRAIKKYGWDNFKHETLFENLTKEEAERKEQELIAKYHSNDKEYGYNIANGGSVNSVSQQTKEKIRETLKSNYVKENHTNYGKHFSEEMKKKLSDSHKGIMDGENHPNYGKEMPESQKKKISDTLKRKGIKPSEEVRRKGAQARKGATNSEYQRKRTSEARSIPVVQMDKSGTVINKFASITEAANSVGSNSANITSVCKGKRKYAAGYAWKYAGD